MNFLKGEAVACQRKVYLNAICCAGREASPPSLGGSLVIKICLKMCGKNSHLEVMMRAFKRSARCPGFPVSFI